MIKTKSKKSTETTVENTRHHIEKYEYFVIMNQYVNGELTDDQIQMLRNDIKKWELFRIRMLVGMNYHDFDGVPTPILKKKLRDIDDWVFNGEQDGKKYISCFTIEQFTKSDDEGELHKSMIDRYGNTFKNVGEYYRSLEYQSMIFQMYYKK